MKEIGHDVFTKTSECKAQYRLKNVSDFSSHNAITLLNKKNNSLILIERYKETNET